MTVLFFALLSDDVSCLRFEFYSKEAKQKKLNEYKACPRKNMALAVLIATQEDWKYFYPIEKVCRSSVTRPIASRFRNSMAFLFENASVAFLFDSGLYPYTFIHKYQS